MIDESQTDAMKAFEKFLDEQENTAKRRDAVPLRTITAEDNPSREVRAFVRRVAAEDGTTFAVAMRGYEAFVAFVRKTEKSEGEDKSFNTQEFARRVLGSRRTFGYNLLRTVKAMEAEASDKGFYGEQEKARQCERCGKDTDPSSYRFCKRHIPLNMPSDEGDGIYCLPPPRALGKVVKQGAEKIKGRALRTKAGEFVFVADEVDGQADDVVQEEKDVDQRDEVQG